MSDQTTIPATAAETASGTELFVPLDRLNKSPKNVRKTPHTKADIEALAASIHANGLLQNIVVEPELDGEGQPTGDYLVPIGEGRRLAYRLLAKRKLVAKDAPVRCLLANAENIREISLAENVIRTAMHPADQYEAFAKLHGEDGMSAEDIATRFGVSTALVMQRLKLGAVSPKLMKRYRAGELNLDQLSAFTITDDHERQERVLKELPSFHRDRSSILHALCEGQVPTSDRRARFVGRDAYETAGGIVTRDLFDPEDGGFFADADLLNRLVAEKLQAEAGKLASEGWKWTEVTPEFDYQATAGMRRIYAKSPALTDEQQERLAALEDECNALAESHDGEIGEADAPEFERLEAEIAALTGKAAYDPAEVARAGVIVCLRQSGEVRIERGFVRAKDETPDADEGERDGQRDMPKGPAPLSEKLVAELTAHRSAALRNELAQRPDIALVATVHTLAADAFDLGNGRVSCLNITVRSTPLTSFAGIGESRASREIEARHEAWARRVPEDAQALWAFIAALTEVERLELLAHCVSLSIDAIRTGGMRGTEGSLAHADVLATALSIDMTAYWQPTAQTYLGRVTKERILQSVAEGVSKSAAENLASMKKPAMAEMAEQRLAGKGWLPEVLRRPGVPVARVEDGPMAASGRDEPIDFPQAAE